jgi:hypothetical protein
MNESTGWLGDPAVAPALPGLLSGLVCQLRRVLASGRPPHERIAAITDELDALAPPPPPPPGLGGPVTGQAAIARLMATSTSPATMLFTEIAGGGTVTFAVWTDCPHATLTDAQCADLDVRPGTRAAHRRGTFALDGRVFADVTSDVLLDELPSEAVAALAAGTPLGAVIAATGRREPVSVLPWGGGLDCSAVIWTLGYGGRRPQRIALAGEQIHPWFCARPLPVEVEWRARELCFGAGRDQQEVVAVP